MIRFSDDLSESGSLTPRNGPNNASESSPPVIRKFINSAIYVEKPLSASISSGNTSIGQRYSSEDLLEIQNLRTKRCTCSSDKNNCPCHISTSFTSVLDIEKKFQVNKKLPERKVSSNVNVAKVKLSPVVASNSIAKPPTIRVIKNRTATKEPAEKNKKRVRTSVKERTSKTNLASPEEREQLLEKERENFKNWLLAKKKAEEEFKKKKETEEQEEELKKLEKEKRHLENQLNFQLWMKKKEEAHLEKRIKEQMQLIAELERKERQLKENERAFKEWLKTAKNRPKPVPLNKGLQSLCSSTSVAYINPNPWHSIT